MSAPPDYVTPFAQAAQMQQPQLGASLMTGIQQGVQTSVAQQQIARQIAQQHQLDAARQQFITNPTAQSVRALAALDPQGFSAIKDAHAQQSTDQQRQDLQDLAAVGGNLQAGRKDDALAIVNQRIQANQKAGQDSTSLQHLADAIQQNPDQAKGIVNMSLAAILGPDKFAEAFGKLGEEQRATAEEPGKLAAQKADLAHTQADTAHLQAETQTTLHPLPKTAAVAGAFNPDGSPIFYNENGPPPAAALPADLNAFVDHLQVTENNTGDPSAKNPRSSATGNGQFINGTWLQMVKSTRPDLADGKTDDQILAMRSDPALSKSVTAAYAQVNAHALEATGLPVNGTTLAMAHKLGPGGAQAVLNADPSAKLSAVLPKQVLVANPQLVKLTAGQYAQGLAQQFGTNPITVGTSAADTAALTGDDYLKTLPPAKQAQIRGIANGDIPLPTGRAAMTGPGQVLMQQVLQYDPTANAINLDARKKTREDFTSGISSKAITAINTVTGHLVGLDSAITRLGNNDVALGNNTASNFVRSHVGDRDKIKALADFNFFRTAVSNELTKVFRGQNGAEADIKGWLDQLQPNAPETQQRQAARSMIEGMKSRLEALGQQYSQGMGKTTDPLQLLSPHARQQLARLENGEAAANAPPAIAVQYLKAHPDLAGNFDAKYGAGASARVLGR